MLSLLFTVTMVTDVILFYCEAMVEKSVTLFTQSINVPLLCRAVYSHSEPVFTHILTKHIWINHWKTLIQLDSFSKYSQENLKG